MPNLRQYHCGCPVGTGFRIGGSRHGISTAGPRTAPRRGAVLDTRASSWISHTGRPAAEPVFLAPVGSCAAAGNGMPRLDLKGLEVSSRSPEVAPPGIGMLRPDPLRPEGSRRFFSPKLVDSLASAAAGPGYLSWLLPVLRQAGMAAMVIVLNTLSMEDAVKDIVENMVAMGARIPGVRPGTATLTFLRESRDAARAIGGVLLATLTLVATAADSAFSAAAGLQMGFPSLLIIVGSVVALRRSFVAHQQLPRLLAVLRTKFQHQPHQHASARPLHL